MPELCQIIHESIVRSSCASSNYPVSLVGTKVVKWCLAACLHAVTQNSSPGE